MAIPAKPTVTDFPPAPQRGEARNTFTTKSNNLVAHYPTFVTEMNDAIDWQDLVFTATETEATNAATSASDAATSETNALASANAAALSETNAATSESNAEASATAAQGFAADAELAAESATISNFVGRWEDQAGSATVPTAVYHNEVYWQLLANLADITLSEPGVTNDWAPVESKVVWAPISTSQTLVGNVSYAVDFTTGPLTLTLPVAPLTNDFIRLYRDGGEITGSIIARNGNTIMGLAEDLTIDFEATSLYLVYNGTDWRVVQ